MENRSLTLRRIRARAVHVPMPRPLATASGAVTFAPLLLVDLEAGGMIGRGYAFCPSAAVLRPLAALVEEMAPMLIGQPLAPFDLERLLARRFRLLGLQGLVLMAMSTLDSAAWDALAKSHGKPLVEVLGGSRRPIPAYNSNGLGLSDPARLGAEAKSLAKGFKAIKLRLGYPTLEQDLLAVRTVRRAIGSKVALMTDYNQGLAVGEAVRRADALDDEGLAWIEEPTDAHDHAGHARIRAAAETPIQLGENFWGVEDMARAIAAGAGDLTMPDLARIGGVSGFVRAAALAQGAGLPMSSHLYPEISAHLLAVTPGAHYLEYVDWAAPILTQPLEIVDGAAAIPARAGHGMEWDEKAVRRYRPE
ncbi:MAG: mandelate racemase [Alphaproteobacteria bacterium]|nr:mandelate racemase [Alphaproteobacteria bacterium]